MKRINKNIENKEKVRVATKAATEACEDIFGPGCSLDAENLADAIISGAAPSGGAIPAHQDYPNWKHLVENVEQAPLLLRQCIIIRTVGAVHDYEVEQREKDDRPLTLSEYAWCMPWWLLSVDKIIMVAKDPDVEAVLRALRVVKPTVCGGFRMIVRTDDSIYRDGFDEVYRKYSRKHQRLAGVCQENLTDHIRDGKKFYRHLPDIVVEDLKIDPTIPLVIKRDIMAGHGAVLTKAELVSGEPEIVVDASADAKPKFDIKDCIIGYVDDDGNPVEVQQA